MSEQTQKTITFINRRAPYGHDNALIGLDLVMASSVFDQRVNYLFVDDGVYQLLTEQDTAGIETKNLLKPMQALKIYDVENVFVDSEALEKRGLKTADLALQVEALSAEQVRALVSESDLVFNL